MNKKKHIDELFKEQLQNFEATPSPEVWSNIQARMKKEKEDRKIIPIWWKLGGVAAVLALLLALNFVFKPFAGDTTPVIVTEEKDKTPSEKENADEIIKEDAVVESQRFASEEDGDTTPKLKKSDVEPENETTIHESKKERNAVVVATEVKENINRQDQQLIKKDASVETVTNKEALGVAETEKIDPSKVTSEKNKILRGEADKNDPASKDAVQEGIAQGVAKEAAKISDKKEAIAAKTNERIQKTNIKDDPLLPKDASELRKDETNVNKTKEAIAAEVEKQDPLQQKNEEEEVEAKKKSIFDAIEEAKEDAVTKVEDKDIRNWEVTPNIGPVFYNSLSGGSSLDPSFADNSQSGDVNMSYGVQVSYAITDRLSVRSGVSNVDLGYRTGDVELATGPVAIALSTVDYGGRSVVLSAFDNGTLNNLPPPSDEGNPFAGLRPKSTSGNAEIIQNLSYYEVPMELKYAVLNKRFGVNMIGGFSTLFLGNNEIAVQDGSFRDVLGEANNLSSVSFSTNIGLGFDYKISKRLKFNVEPMFKYQLNPYTDSSVDFQPYYFGIYSGLSFKF